MKKILLLLTCSLGMGSCTVLTDNSKLELGTNPITCPKDDERFLDFEITLEEFNVHTDDRVVVELIDKNDGKNDRIARAAITVFQIPDRKIIFPCILERNKNQYEVHVWQESLNPRVDARAYWPAPVPTEHQWRFPQDPSVAVNAARERKGWDTENTLGYIHKSDFDDLNAPGIRPRPNAMLKPLAITFENEGAFDGKYVYIFIREFESDDQLIPIKAVGMYRMQIRTFDFDMQSIGETIRPEIVQKFLNQKGVFVPQAVEQGKRYEIAVWVDTNPDFLYTKQRGGVVGEDNSWKFSGSPDIIDMLGQVSVMSGKIDLSDTNQFLDLGLRTELVD